MAIAITTFAVTRASRPHHWFTIISSSPTVRDDVLGGVGDAISGKVGGEKMLTDYGDGGRNRIKGKRGKNINFYSPLDSHSTNTESIN
ncbi:hypothetical protein L1987_33160 [Smallanthus sonchifolius]|uniref:Uncharacterized protein n=1 Tax=Smallanthus sonchifolius TaxID=185202 RepID=A0ACB9HRG7_9ASTR|nr:hypothetical protein L1987_33160 [Smallanthus sonchifolius]